LGHHQCTTDQTDVVTTYQKWGAWGVPQDSSNGRRKAKQRGTQRSIQAPTAINHPDSRGARAPTATITAARTTDADDIYIYIRIKSSTLLHSPDRPCDRAAGLRKRSARLRRCSESAGRCTMARMPLNRVRGLAPLVGGERAVWLLHHVPRVVFHTLRRRGAGGV
jgi:hypothetical protein